MRNHLIISTALAAACSLLAAQFSYSAEPIISTAAEQTVLIPKTPDGGLPPVIGVQNIQVFRATRGVPELAEGKGWTYNHHMDLAQWKGRMYLAWTNGEKDEDIWPSHELFITSEDGVTWTKPAELFPQGVSTSLRMYFFHAPNGHMLAIAGLRTGTDKLDEAKKGGAVVREILADHTLGAAYTLIDSPPPGKAMIPQPRYDTAPDPAFVQACGQLLANHAFLETQDSGMLLGKNRMAIYKDAPSDFGKAFSFFHRSDGTLVGIGKKAYVITSNNEGLNWTAPVKASSMVVGNAKEWGQRTSDGKYAMIYNPSVKDRYPLVSVTSDDGITFNTMRVVHGEVSPQRYAGLNRSIGPQYIRGISEWARDDTIIKGPGAKDMWIVYSGSKEDIWVSRIPVPLRSVETGPVHDAFATPGALFANWNTYSPKWGSVSIVDEQGATALKLEDRDPHDYAKAERVFKETSDLTISLKLLVKKAVDKGRLEIDVRPAFGEARPIRLALIDGQLTAANGPDATVTSCGTLITDQWYSLLIHATGKLNTFDVRLNDAAPQSFILAEKIETFQRLVLRTGPYRTLGDGKFIDSQTDKPTEPISFLVRDVNIE